MSSPYPEYVDLRQAADRSQAFSGSMAVARLERLAPLLVAPDGVIEFELRFSRDRTRRVLIEGRFSTTVRQLCQRCLEAVEIPLAGELRLSPVAGPDEAERLPAELDPVLVDDGRVRIVDLIEDEVLLALPPVPLHRAGSCKSGAVVGENETGETRRENPFAVLRALKK